MSVHTSAAPQLRAVRGPSALGGGARRFFDLLWLLAVTEFKRTYFATVLGYLWTMLRPLMLFGVLLFVFTQVFKLGSTVTDYPVLLLLGLVIFSLFQEGTQNSVMSVASKEAVVRKTQFPRLVIPLATVLTCCFNFLLNMIVVFIFILAWGVPPHWDWLLFPFAIAALLVLTCAVSMMLSVLYIRYRDVSIIWVVLAQVLLYATPVLYPVEKLGNPLIEHLMMINPLAVIIEQIRVWVLPESGGPSAAAAAGGAVHLLPAVAIYVAICIFSVWIFSREAPHVAENL